MTTNNSQNSQYTNNADGFTLGGGTTVRTLTATGSNITLNGSGTNTYTMPSATDTLVGRASTDTLTNKTINASQLVNATVTASKMDFTSFNGSTDANGWTTFTNGNGKTCYSRTGATSSITLGAGPSFNNYSISGPVGVTLSFTNCVVTGAFMANSDRAVSSYLYTMSSSALSIAVFNAYTGGGFTFTPQYQVIITML